MMELIKQLQELNPEWTVRVEYNKSLYLDGTMTPHLIVMFGKYIHEQFQEGFISKIDHNFYLENQIDINHLCDYYECFEGGFEDDLKDCLETMIKEISLIKEKKNE